MKIKGARLFQLILLLAVAACLASCVVYGEIPGIWVGEYHGGPVYSYDYYPDAGVYYAPGPSLWFWFEGNEWHHGARLPGHIHAGGHHFRFKSDAHEPFRVHEGVQRHFHR